MQICDTILLNLDSLVHRILERSLGFSISPFSRQQSNANLRAGSSSIWIFESGSQFKLETIKIKYRNIYLDNVLLNV